RRRSRLADMVARNRDRIPFGCIFRKPAEHVSRDPERTFRRINVVASSNVLLEHVILTSTAKRSYLYALLLGYRDIERHNDRSSGVDRDRSRNLRKVDSLKERAHVFEMRDRDTDFSHLPFRPRIVRIKPQLRGKIESNREPGCALR